MPILEYHFAYQEHADNHALDPSDQDLIEQAKSACGKAYAPYSRFNVGVAIRSVDGRITIGSNQENEAFPIGQCAERVALYSMVHSLGRLAIDTMAIVVDHPDQKTPGSPCGSCRQMLLEYRRAQANPIRLLLTLSGGGPVLDIKDVTDLLPLAFNGSFLGL